jgi:hypothetical protein
MRRYTVGVAGQTVNLLLSSSGSATLSRCTIFVLLESQQLQEVTTKLLASFYGDFSISQMPYECES